MTVEQETRAWHWLRKEKFRSDVVSASLSGLIITLVLNPGLWLRVLGVVAVGLIIAGVCWLVTWVRARRDALRVDPPPRHSVGNLPSRRPLPHVPGKLPPLLDLQFRPSRPLRPRRPPVAPRSTWQRR